jgi:PAS domain S-box-containing protein
MWLATWNGLDRFDPTNNRFITYKRDMQSKAELYFDIAEDQNGTFWLGGNSGLQHFDPATGAFVGFQHKLNDPQSLSDNRVTSVHIDGAGNIWAATHGGLNRLDRQSGTFTTYYVKDGLPSNRAHCILESRRGDIWISTNRGISRFDPNAKTFKNYSIADGLPGMDLTGFRTCFESSTGEMFFGGFSGATSFYPDRVVDNLSIPPIVFTDFRLSGNSVAVGEGSLLEKSINYTDHLTLSHKQNNFSVEFAALRYSSPATTRYRYRLDDLDSQWNEVGGDQRVVNYTSLLPGRYAFHVQAATGQSGWSANSATLYIRVLPPWWSTWWFRSAIATLSVALLWGGYRWRIEQLKHQERKLTDVIETIPTFAWSALPDGSVDFVNRHWQEYTGLSPAKTSGAGWEAAVHPADLKGHLEKWRASLTSGEPFENELRYRRAMDGQYRRFLARAVPLRDARGNVLKWYGISTDIEDRKHAEEERETLREDLAHINRVNTMGELTASLSHEIKQPIGAAVTNADTCVRLLDRDEPDVPEAREAALEMAKDARRAAHIIDRVRLLYRKAPSHLELVDANEAIGEMVRILHSEANRHSVTIRTDLVEGLPKVIADKVQLQQVLMNLMLNGIEAMKKTGGILTVKPQLGQDSRVLISVSDTGEGLPTENADQIFNAFFTTKPEGSGMGLAISRSIIQSHGGRLWATSNDGAGATFHFTLPSAPEVTKAAAPKT